MRDVEPDRTTLIWPPASGVGGRSYRRETLLAKISHRLELISQAQHRLALNRTLLQEQATRLRLGVPVDEVRVALRRAGLVGRRRRRPVGDDAARRVRS